MLQRRTDKTPIRPATARVIDCGVDWLTVTSSKDNADHELVLFSWYEIMKERRRWTGTYEEKTFLGYQGTATDGIFVGTRYDGAMIRVSGEFSREIWSSINAKGSSITRLDVQVTVQYESDGPTPPRAAAIQAENANAEMPANRKRNVEEHTDNKEGHTTYIGSRQSDSFSRTYNKSAQDPDKYGDGAFRYEVQFNKGLASQVHSAMLQHQENAEAAAIAIVWDWYERRGVIPVFRRSSVVVPLKRDVLPLTDLDRKLKWLYTQVRPTVTDLLGQTTREAVLVALLGNELGKQVETSLVSFFLADLVPPLYITDKQPASQEGEQEGEQEA